MLRSKWTAVLAIAVIAVSVGMNLDYWKDQTGQTEGVVIDDADPPPDPEKLSPEVNTAGFVPAPKPAAVEAESPVAPIVEVVAEASAETDEIMERLTHIFSPPAVRSGGPVPERLRRWHALAELRSGMTMEELVNSAHAMRAKIANGDAATDGKAVVSVDDVEGERGQPGKVQSSPPHGTTKQPAAPIDPLESPRIDCIIAAGEASVCRVNGVKLRIGDLYPGTSWKVVSIQARKVMMSNGTSDRGFHLSDVRQDSTATAREPVSPEQSDGASKKDGAKE